MTVLEQGPTGYAERDQEEFEAAKEFLKAKGSDPRALDFLRKWGRLTFGGSDGTFYFEKFRRKEVVIRDEYQFYPYLMVNYFGRGIKGGPASLTVRHERWGWSPQFELRALPVSGVSLEESPTETKVVFSAPWDEAKVKISEDGSLFLEGRISPPPPPELPPQ